MPPRVSPPLRDYSLEELEVLLQSVKSAITAREAMPAQDAAVAPVIGDALQAAGPPSAAPAGDSEAQTHRAEHVEVLTDAPTPAAAVTQPSVAANVEPPAPAAVIRFMHPANRKMAWSGEGPQPEWIDAYLAQGGSWIALQNTAEKLAPRKR